MMTHEEAKLEMKQLKNIAEKFGYKLQLSYYFETCLVFFKHSNIGEFIGFCDYTKKWIYWNDYNKGFYSDNLLGILTLESENNF